MLLLLRYILVLSNKDTFKMGFGLPFKTQWRLHFSIFLFFIQTLIRIPIDPSEGEAVRPFAPPDVEPTSRRPQIGDSAGENLFLKIKIFKT